MLAQVKTRAPKFPGLVGDREIFADILKSGKKFLVVSRSEGLGDVLFAIGHAWLYCKKTGRTLIVDLANSRYLEDKELNAASELLRIPAEFDGVKILVPRRVSWNLRQVLSSGWLIQTAFLHKPSILAYINSIKQKCFKYTPSLSGYLFKQQKKTLERERSLIRSGENPRSKFISFRGCHSEFLEEITPFMKAISPCPEAESFIREFIRKLDGPFVGIHVRYYDPTLPDCRHTEYWLDFENALEQIQKQIRKAKLNMNPSCAVFLATDSSDVECGLTNLRNDIVTMTKQFGDSSAAELHSHSLSNLGLAAISEMFLLCHSTVLIRYPPSRSWFSELAARTCPKVIE